MTLWFVKSFSISFGKIPQKYFSKCFVAESAELVYTLFNFYAVEPLETNFQNKLISQAWRREKIIEIFFQEKHF